MTDNESIFNSELDQLLLQPDFYTVFSLRIPGCWDAHGQTWYSTTEYDKCVTMRSFEWALDTSFSFWAECKNLSRPCQLFYQRFPCVLCSSRTCMVMIPGREDPNTATPLQHITHGSDKSGMGTTNASAKRILLFKHHRYREAWWF